MKIQGSIAEAVLTRDEITLHLVATGVLAFASAVQRGRSVFPYVNELQIGLNRLGAAALRSGSVPPQSVPELLMWCRRPLAEWPVRLDVEAADEIGSFMDGVLPTESCEMWACASSDVEAELTEEKLLLNVLAACRQANSPEAYVAFRRLVIEHPVLTALEFQQHCSKWPLALLAEFVVASYEPAPAACISADRELICCEHCGNLLLSNLEGDLVCEEERCRRGFRVNGRRRKSGERRRLKSGDEVSWLKRGLRRFVAAPGRAELRLEKRLLELGLQVEMWPNFDRYDLRILFADGMAWAVDVKDWADPRSLARRISAQMPNPIPLDPPWTRAYFVFPQERRTARHDYGRAFKNSCSRLPPNLRVSFENEFVADVRHALGAS